MSEDFLFDKILEQAQSSAFEYVDRSVLDKDKDSNILKPTCLLGSMYHNINTKGEKIISNEKIQTALRDMEKNNILIFSAGFSEFFNKLGKDLNKVDSKKESIKKNIKIVSNIKQQNFESSIKNQETLKIIVNEGEFDPFVEA